MGKLTKLALGSAFVGAVGATAYTFVKKYKALKPEVAPAENENAEDRDYTCIDFDVAKEAAKETATSIKDASIKAYGVFKDSAKTISENIKENYGDSIDAAKEKASETFDAAKEKASETFDDVKEKISDKYDDFKEKNPGFSDTVDKIKDTFDSIKGKFTEEDVVDAEATEVADETADASNTNEGLDEVINEAKQQGEDFVQQL